MFEPLAMWLAPTFAGVATVVDYGLFFGIWPLSFVLMRLLNSKLDPLSSGLPNAVVAPARGVFYAHALLSDSFAQRSLHRSSKELRSRFPNYVVGLSWLGVAALWLSGIGLVVRCLRIWVE